MSKTVGIVDYGMGNLFSVSRAVEQCGGTPVFIQTAEDLRKAERLILPGVGAFSDGMAGLRSLGLIDALVDYGRSGRPMLGICLGMQMLLETNEEFGLHEGLGLIPGRVTAIPKTGAAGKPHKVPHIGWSALNPVNADWQETILKGIPAGTTVYFVHSFTAFPQDEAHRLADADYNGRRISAVVKSGNLYGCQFHPEKSGPWGLKILENFMSLN
jgi:glutamine amidotransferase